MAAAWGSIYGMWLYANHETLIGQEAINLTRNLGCSVIYVSNDDEPHLELAGVAYRGLDQIRTAVETQRALQKLRQQTFTGTFMIAGPRVIGPAGAAPADAAPAAASAVEETLEQLDARLKQDRRFARPIGETAPDPTPVDHAYTRFVHGVSETVDLETARCMREAQIRTTNKIELTAPAATDAVNPQHYSGDLVMRIIERFKLGFCLGNVIKYILRHESKNGLEDLKKARWYLDREIAVREGTITKTVE